MKVRDLRIFLFDYISIYTMDEFFEPVDLVNKVKYEDIPEEFLDREVFSIGAKDTCHVDIRVR